MKRNKFPERALFWTVMAAMDKSHVTYVMMLWQRVEDGNGGKTEEEAGSA